MLITDDPSISHSYDRLLQRIEAQGVAPWIEGKVKGPDREGLIFLCKFGFFTGILTKAEIGQMLKLERGELRQLVRSWYDDHRAKGCGTC
ncbi:MAG: hypothetical protein HY910_08195 [Desulfarculus sp.]|nr:hypothetical protein [Desulfarculus sp.]